MSAEKERPVLEVIRQIKAGSLDPQHLAAAERQACVMHLSAEGLSVPEIAQVLKRSERTITRDRRAIQEANALQQDPKFAGEMAGILLSEADACISRMRRAVRSADTPAAVRVEAERASFAIRSEVCQRLQSLGFLPTAAQKMEASLTHQATEIPSFEQIDGEVVRLIEIHQQQSPDEGVEAPQKLLEFKNKISRAKLATEVQAASEEVAGDDQ